MARVKGITGNKSPKTGEANIYEVIREENTTPEDYAKVSWQLYLKDEKASTPRPIVQLEGFERIHLKKGETKTVRFTITPRQLSLINDKDQRVVEPGWFTVSVGGKQPDGSKDNQSGRFKISGKPLLLEK